MLPIRSAIPVMKVNFGYENRDRGYYMPACGYEFYLRVSTRYRTSERNCLLYKHANNDVFDGYLKISDHFPRAKLFRRLDERFRTISEDRRM